MTSTHAAVAVDEPVRGLRVHSRTANLDAAARAKIDWLVGLGQTQARQKAELEAIQRASQAVQRTLQGLQQQVGTRLDEIAGLVVELGLAVAREVVGAAVDQGLVDPTPTVVHCLRDCVHGAESKDLVVHLHPDDLGLVMARLAAMPELQEQIADAQLLPDATLARGAVRAETGAGRLRYDPRESIERVAEAVRSAAAAGVPQ